MEDSVQADLRRCRALYYSSVLYQPLAGPDHDFCLDLIHRHPDAKRKIGCGIAYFEIRVSPGNHGRRSFWLVRLDGTATDWSYLKCLYPDGSKRSYLLHALRAAVVDQILDFKQRALANGEHCALTGKPLDEHCVVDHHKPSFDKLVNAFVACMGGPGRFHTVPVEPEVRDGRHARRRLVDREVHEAWIAYHREHANLRALAFPTHPPRRRRRQAKEA